MGRDQHPIEHSHKLRDHGFQWLALLTQRRFGRGCIIRLARRPQNGRLRLQAIDAVQHP
jgi:hypothetical protein